MEHLDLSWAGIMTIVTLVGVVSAVFSSTVTHVVTLYRAKKDLVDHEGLNKALADCKEVCKIAFDALEEQHSMCSEDVSKQFGEQTKTLRDQEKLLKQGYLEFTAIRLAMSEIFDALKIPGGREKWLQIRDDVMNDRST